MNRWPSIGRTGPRFGLFLAWGCSFEILWNRVVERGFVRVLATGAAVLFLAQLGFKTVVRNAVWDDPVGLSSEAVRYAPEHWMPRMLLAEAYRQAGSCVEAVPEYRAAISLAARGAVSVYEARRLPNRGGAL